MHGRYDNFFFFWSVKEISLKSAKGPTQEKHLARERKKVGYDNLKTKRQKQGIT
jgi:hypothetical protein